MLLFFVSLFCVMNAEAETYAVIDGIHYVLDDGKAIVASCDYEGDIVIPSTVMYDGLQYTVSAIGERTFYGCKNLKSVTIPNSVNSIGNNAFRGCTGLKTIVIPNSVSEIYSSAFDDYPKYKIFCYPIPYHKLNPFVNNVHFYLCGAPVYFLLSTGSEYGKENITQSMISWPIMVDKMADNFSDYVDVPLLKVKKMNVYGRNSNDISEKIDGEIIEGQAVFKGLRPHVGYNLTLEVEYSDGTSIISSAYVITENIGLKSLSSYSTSVSLQDVLITGDAGNVEDGGFTIDGKSYSGKDAYLTGLTPGHRYNLRCWASLSTGYSAQTSGTFSTPELELTTLAPKGVSSTSSIVAAKTNISDEETSVGFQWRKSDAPETLIPKEGYAAVYDGQMEGYIKNLQPTSYYDVRPFYKSAEGKYYYGEWVAFDPSDFSFFEPTVHTNAAKDVTDNSATLVGYALAGTDDIVEQGFEYWTADAAGNAPKRIAATLVAAESDKITIAAAGQRMQAAVEGLKPFTTYFCRAYVKTAAGMVYGEHQAFTTDVSSGISTISVDADGAAATIYDVSGRKLDSLRKGVNIVRYPDGTIRKINVK